MRAGLGHIFILLLVQATGCAVLDAARDGGAERSLQVTRMQSLNGGLRAVSDGPGRVQFLQPAAVAVSRTDVYVADPPAGRVYRYDQLSGRVSVVVAEGVTAQTRLATAPDLSVYVVTPGWPLRNFTRTGQLLRTFSPLGISGHYLDAAVDPDSGIIYAVGVHGRSLERIHPTGATTLWPGGESPFMQPRNVALGGSLVYLLDVPCACVWAASRFSPVWRRVASDLKQPVALAADARRLVILDAQSRELRVWFDGIELPAVRYQDVGLTAPVAASLHNGRLYVADPAAASVAVLSVEVR